MPEWQGKSKGSRLGYRIFIWIMRQGGVHPAYFLLYFVTLYYFLFSYRSSRLIFHFLHKRLGLGGTASLLKIYRNYYLFGQTIIDRIVLMSGIPNRFTFHFEGEENLRRMTEMKRGGLLLSAHIGNWEIAGHLLQRLDTKINIVMFDGEHRQLKEYLAGVTGERTANIIVVKNDLSHIYKIKEAFDKNELVCMHADRFLEGVKTMESKFLGENARFPAGPFILAQKFNVPVSFVFAMKESKLHYHFFSSAPQQYVATEQLPVPRQMLENFIREMEKTVKRYPAQWYNYYNFWQQASI